MKSVDYYLSKGFDQKMAEYFASGRKKVISVTPNSDFSLNITFNNSEIRNFDVKPLLLKNTIFESFMDFENFKRVFVDEYGNISWDIDPKIDSSVHWNNRVDICSDVCYVDSIPL